MISRFLPDQGEDNVLNYYVLPLVGTNKTQFGDNFIDTYVAKDCSMVFVEVYNLLTKYEATTTIEGKKLVYFKIPEEFRNDVKLIVESKYSAISDRAKLCIIENSGLSYNKNIGGRVFTSKLILALNKHEKLKEFYLNTFTDKDSPDRDLIREELDRVDLMERVQEQNLID